MDINSPSALLNGLSPREFMRRYWQKKPLLIRAALQVKDYSLTASELFTLAANGDVASRLITRKQDSWRVEQGPFNNKLLAAKPKAPWTLLVQGMNLHHSAMAKLMHQFRFVPDARLDDVMVSYATPGGGVGAHVDSYDVFLLQLQGTRRWQIGPLKTAASKALVPDAPLKLLAQFKPTQSFDLQAGDMLYLPPGYGHDGVALDACLTASIGFRAPRAGELVASMLEQLADVVRQSPAGPFAALYADASQEAVNIPAQLPKELSDFLRKTWQRITPSADDFEQVLGAYLSEPKPQVWFEAHKGITFAKLLSSKKAVQLAPATQLLYGRAALFINGETIAWAEFDAPARQWLKRLANTRQASSEQLKQAPEELYDLLKEWWQAGWLVI
jgi:50S ribosomal protein L16 3-hydroxylase